MSNSVKIGTANKGHSIISLDVIKDWYPKKIAYMGTTVFFQIEDTFYSMERVDFERIFEGKYKKI